MCIDCIDCMFRMGERIDRVLGMIECIRMECKCVEVYLGMRSGAKSVCVLL